MKLKGIKAPFLKKKPELDHATFEQLAALTTEASLGPLDLNLPSVHMKQGISYLTGMHTCYERII